MAAPDEASQSADGIAILLWAAQPEAPDLLVIPFYHAAAAAAMDIPTEIYFTGRSVRLLAPGVAAGLRAGAQHAGSVLDVMREAVMHGAVLLACTQALRDEGIESDGLIAECSGYGGAVQYMARASDLRWRALVF